MRFWDWLLGVKMWMTYCDAFLNSLVWPRTTDRLNVICTKPRACRRSHRFAVARKRSGKRVIVLVHY